ncbi:hypothetical protein [Streptomyces sp. NPDC001652]|uniref:hypothetical protein n=1 Tax=Streptomyces sp. NPDC001652 TaxID=3154393 RepID=UPI0033233626
MPDGSTAQAIADRADKRARTSNRISMAAVAFAAVAACIAAGSLVLGLTNRSEQQDKAAQDAAKSQAEQIDVSRGIDHDDVVYVRNWSSKSYTKVVLRLATANDAFRYAVLETLPGCYEWEVTDKELERQHLQPVPAASGFIASSGSIEVSFNDAHGLIWDQRESAPLRKNGYWDTRYMKSDKSTEFLAHSVELGEETYRRIAGCSGQ